VWSLSLKRAPARYAQAHVELTHVKAVAGPARDIVRMTATGRVRSADSSSEGKKAHLQLRVYQQHGRLAITQFEGDASGLLSLLLLLLP
jgi:hypothetical protein